MLYLADQTTEGVLELYRVPFATPGASTKLNGPLVAGGNVFFGIGMTPDNSAVVYRATERTANTIELYRVPLATPGVSTKLNGVLPPNADVGGFQIAPNGTSVVYVDFRKGFKYCAAFCRCEDGSASSPFRHARSKHEAHWAT